MSVCSKVLVVGVGNLLRRDDGIGIHAITALNGLVPDGVELVDAGTSVLDFLLDYAGRERVVFIDALSVGRSPGTIYRLSAQDLISNSPLSEAAADESSHESHSTEAHDNGPMSLHELGLPEALALARAARIQIDRASIVGMEPATLEWGTELSPEVRDRLPVLVQAVLAEIAREEA